MPDFLLELRCEEIPARMQAGARAELEKLFRRELTSAGIDVTGVTVWSTPRRLALIARALPVESAAKSTEVKGPRVGAPDQAIDGFLRRYEAKRADLIERNDIYFLPQMAAGRPMFRVLQEAIPAIVRDFAWPKSMRWGAASISTESPRWVRPLSGIVAILGEDLVECEGAGVVSGYATLGHRFHHAGEITIGGAHDYQEKLRACHVIVDHEERAALIREGAAQAAAEAGLTLVEDEGLVIENAGLTEWPVPLLGRFDEAFLDVPPEVIQLTARVNQKYLVCHDSSGNLANAFVCTANIAAEDGGAAIVDGNRKVLAARLSDARFFWEQDRKIALADQAKKLERITFHEKLGTVADKAERVAKLARWLVEEGIVGETSPSSHTSPARPEPVDRRGATVAEGASTSSARAKLADLTEQAARLAKADLVTEMVGEFPELQGVMGGYYARAEGLPDAVADAIRDHYKPVGQGDEVPTAPVTVAVSLADKLDTLVSFFVIKERPTGSRDPFALRRAALGIIEIILRNDLRLELDYATAKASGCLFRQLETGQFDRDDAWRAEHHGAELYRAVPDFFVERLKVQQREAGVRHDLIDAVFQLGQRKDEIVGNLARVKALQSFVGTEDGANLLAGYKRAANILKKEDWHGIEGEIARTGEEDPLALVDDPDLGPIIKAKLEEKKNKSLSYTPEDAETALIAALDSAEPTASAAVEAEDFAAAMRALASLRAPIDRFFTEVTVNDPDRDKRTARLDLLLRFRDAVHRVADFSRIEG